MFSKVRRRMRCEVQGCKKVAAYAFGTKGIDYPICEEHFQELVNDIKIYCGLSEETNSEEKEIKAKDETENSNAEYYTCKHCGTKFNKALTTQGEFLKHCKACKKEHEETEKEG